MSQPDSKLALRVRYPLSLLLTIRYRSPSWIMYWIFGNIFIHLLFHYFKNYNYFFSRNHKDHPKFHRRTWRSSSDFFFAICLLTHMHSCTLLHLIYWNFRNGIAQKNQRWYLLRSWLKSDQKENSWKL